MVWNSKRQSIWFSLLNGHAIKNCFLNDFLLKWPKKKTMVKICEGLLPRSDTHWDFQLTLQIIYQDRKLSCVYCFVQELLFFKDLLCNLCTWQVLLRSRSKWQLPTPVGIWTVLFYLKVFTHTLKSLLGIWKF